MGDTQNAEFPPATGAKPQSSTPYSQAAGVIALSAVLLVGVRAASEMAMMSAHGSDPQMPIWSVFMLVKLLLWLGTGLVGWLVVVIWRNRLGLVIGLVLLVAWATSICWASWEYNRGRQALTDASNPSTSPVRLRELLEFDGLQAGYELDNRLASNLNSPPDVLRKLYQRDQLGTLTMLASNPNTPQEILEQLVEHDDEWIQRSLAQNSKLPESVRRKVKAHKE